MRKNYYSTEVECSEKIVSSVVSIFIEENITTDYLLTVYLRVLIWFILNKIFELFILLKHKSYKCEFETSSPEYKCVRWNSLKQEWSYDGCIHEKLFGDLHKCICNQIGDIALMYLVKNVDFFWIAYLIGVAGNSLSILCLLATAFMFIKKRLSAICIYLLNSLNL